MALRPSPRAEFRMIPDRIGKYEVRGLLGRGAMGVVYDGWDPTIDRRVAIKTVTSANAPTDEDAREALDRFRREAKAAGRLQHNNIVSVFDAGQTEDIAYIVMEFIEGSSLKELLDGAGPFKPDEAADIMRQVLAGLGYSHRRGVVHRDIKPANVMITGDGAVKIADFGIARMESSTATAVGAIIGTPAYMPPEQFLGEPADARSDIYASGAMLFHMLTGRRMYEGSIASIMSRALSDSPRPLPSGTSAGLPRGWDDLVARATARNPANRFPDAASFAVALDRLAGSATTSAQDNANDTVVIGKSLPTESAPRSALLGRHILFGGIAAACFLAAMPAMFGFFSAPHPPGKSSVPVPATNTKDVVVPTAGMPPAAAPEIVPASLPSGPAFVASLQGLSCALISVQSQGNAITLHGAASKNALSALRTMKSQAEIEIGPGLETVPDEDCTILDDVRPFAGENGPLLSMRAGPLIFQTNENMHLKIRMPDFPAWLIVDYISSDGKATRIFPNEKPDKKYTRRDPSRLFAGSEVFALEYPHYFLQANSPFGTDMVVAIASAAPLSFPNTPRDEDLGAYVAGLHSVLAEAQRRNVPVAAGVIALRTVKKK